MVQQWQRLLENFELSRRIDPDDRPIRLISREFGCKDRSRGVLGIPQIAMFLLRQRISLLQQYVGEMAQQYKLTWTTPAEVMLTQAMPSSLTNLPLDLLSCPRIDAKRASLWC